MSRGIYFSSIFLVILSSSVLSAQPTTQPDGLTRDFTVSPMRVQQLNGVDTFLYGEAETTLADIRQPWTCC